VDVRQDGAHDEVVGEITGPYQIGQTFVAGADNLAAVQVFGATFGHAATGRLRFHLRADAASPTDLATAELDAATLGDDAMWTFRFAPVRQARGRTFYFYLEAPDVPEDQAVTVYYTKGNPYRAGSRMQDGQPAGGDLVFRTLAALNADAPPFVRRAAGAGSPVAFYENRAARPRAWIVNQVEVLADPAARLRRLTDPAFDRVYSAVLSAPLPPDQALPPASAAAATSAVTITRAAPEAVDLAVSTTAPGLLILADQAFPGWTATRDGTPVPILTVDHALRGVYLPAGAHTVAFRYTPLSFSFGALASGVALLVVGILLFDPRKNTKKRQREPS
jgi:hypothetical protein